MLLVQLRQIRALQRVSEFIKRFFLNDIIIPVFIFPSLLHLWLRNVLRELQSLLPGGLFLRHLFRLNRRLHLIALVLHPDLFGVLLCLFLLLPRPFPVFAAYVRTQSAQLHALERRLHLFELLHRVRLVPRLRIGRLLLRPLLYVLLVCQFYLLVHVLSSRIMLLLLLLLLWRGDIHQVLLLLLLGDQLLLLLKHKHLVLHKQDLLLQLLRGQGLVRLYV